jgi:hypothetical protein
VVWLFSEMMPVTCRFRTIGDGISLQLLILQTMLPTGNSPVSMGNRKLERERKHAWDLLCHLQLFSPKACLCVGDFNEILDETKKN